MKIIILLLLLVHTYATYKAGYYRGCESVWDKIINRIKAVESEEQNVL